MMDEIQTYLGADGLMHCTVCKEPVEAFYPKGSLLEMKKHHRQCACERQAYAEEAQYFKEKERRELVVRNKKICFEEKEMEGFTFQNVDRDSSAIRIAEEYVANWLHFNSRSGDQLEQEKVIWLPVLQTHCWNKKLP